MTRYSRLVSLLLFVLLSVADAQAAERTVTLRISSMSCVGCKYIVRSALAKVAGVRRVEISYASRTAVVTYDDARTNVRALTEATGKQGFPSRVIKSGGAS